MQQKYTHEIAVGESKNKLKFCNALIAWTWCSPEQTKQLQPRKSQQILQNILFWEGKDRLQWQGMEITGRTENMANNSGRNALASRYRELWQKMSSGVIKTEKGNLS